jgi:hypothetical protein
MVQQSEIPQMEFLSRLAKVPVVHSAIGLATDAYGKAKDSGPVLIQKTLSKAEGTVKFAAEVVALPMVQSLGGPIHVVDNLACKTLDKVEETLPVMKQTPEEIMKNTRTYVSDKLQPIQNTVGTVYNAATLTTDLLLSNPFGRLALYSVESTVLTVHNCIDYLIPPVAEEKAVVSEPPAEPSKKIIWSVQRSADAAFKIQHRLSARAQLSLHDLGLTGLLYTGVLVNLLEWTQTNLKDIQSLGLPTKLHQMALEYRDEASKLTNTFDDVVLLASVLSKKIAGLVGDGLAVVAALPDSDLIKIVRLQLSIALALSLDFVSRIASILTSKNVLENTTKFLKTDFPLVHQALMAIKELGATVTTKPHVA